MLSVVFAGCNENNNQGKTYTFRFLERNDMNSTQPVYQWRYYLVFPSIGSANRYWVTVHLNGHPLTEDQPDNQRIYTTGYPSTWEEAASWMEEYTNGTRFYLIGGYDYYYESVDELTVAYEMRDTQIASFQNWTYDIVADTQ